MLLSQCSNCGKNFEINYEGILFCSSLCEEKHDLFANNRGVSPVHVSYLTSEQLEAYKNKTSKLEANKKPHRVADWRWPQNRRKNG